jgi:hypothetical protein
MGFLVSTSTIGKVTTEELLEVFEDTFCEFDDEQRTTVDFCINIRNEYSFIIDVSFDLSEIPTVETKEHFNAVMKIMEKRLGMKFIKLHGEIVRRSRLLFEFYTPMPNSL